MVTANLLTVGHDTTDAGPWVTASVSPGANRLVVVYTTVVGTVDPGPVGVVSGHGAAWTKKFEDAKLRSPSVYYYITGASPASGPITITPTAGGVQGCLWAVMEYALFNPLNPIPQVVLDRGNPSVVPLAAPLAGSLLTGYAFANANTDITFAGNNGAAFTEVGASLMSTPVTWHEVDVQPSPAASSSVTASFVSTTATGGALIAEISNAVLVTVSSSRLTRWNVAAFPLRTFTGAMTPAGTPRRAMTKLPGGFLTPAGIRRGTLARRFDGVLIPGGALRKGGAYLTKRWTGAVGSSGSVGRILTRMKGMSGSIGPSGVARKTISRHHGGAVTPLGTYRRAPLARRFLGVLTTAGSLATQFFHRIYGRSGAVEIRLGDIGEVELAPYLRERLDLEVWTAADVLYPGQYAWDATGIPERPVARPLPPTAVSALAGFQQATVSFAPPRDDGGSPILDYTVTASTGQSATGAESPIAVPGLVNGVAVAFTVTARNERGESQPSDPSPPVTPTGSLADPPEAVTIMTGVSGQASFSWSAPANSGGNPILDYSVQLSTGAVATVTGLTHTFTGIPNGTKVSAVVSTRTVNGLSRPSNRSKELYVGTVPGAPVITSWVAGNGQATVKFTAPASDGGVPPFRYLLRVYYGGSAIAEPGTKIIYPGEPFEHTFTGLGNGEPWQVGVSAQNDIGTGPAARSASVIPAAPVTVITTPRTATTAATTSQQLTIPKPSGTVAGEFLIATVCHGEDQNEITPPNDWSVVDYWDFADVTYGVWFHRVTAADASVTGWTWTITGPQAGQNTSGGMQSYAGVHPTAPFDNSPDSTIARVDYAEIASGTTLGVAHSWTVPSGAVVGCLFSQTFTGVAPPSTWTEDYERNIGTRIAEQAHKVFSAANPGGSTYTWTLTGSGAAAAVVFVLRAG